MARLFGHQKQGIFSSSSSKLTAAHSRKAGVQSSTENYVWASHKQHIFNDNNNFCLQNYNIITSKVENLIYSKNNDYLNVFNVF